MNENGTDFADSEQQISVESDDDDEGDDSPIEMTLVNRKQRDEVSAGARKSRSKRKNKEEK